MLGARGLRRVVLPAMAVALFVIGGVVRADAPAEPMEVGALIEAMQARADGLAGLSGVLGTAMSVPGQGKWSGVPFVFRAPDCYARKDGYVARVPGEEPAKQDDAWCIYKAGWLYVRPKAVTLRGGGGDPGKTVSMPRGQCRKVRPGYLVEVYDHRTDFDKNVWGNDTDVLLMVNLMPGSWFAAVMDDLKAGPIEDLAGRPCYTVLDVQPPPKEGQPRSLCSRRAPRKYYVNAETFVCERLVWGSEKKEDPFEGAGKDSVAGSVQKVGGVLLPTTYALRSCNKSGVYFALESTLQDLEVKQADSVPDAEFDAYGLYPEPLPLIWQPMADAAELEAHLATNPDDVGAWLSLADTYYIGRDYAKARDALTRADELVAGKECAEYSFDRDWLMALVFPHVKDQEAGAQGE